MTFTRTPFTSVGLFDGPAPAPGALLPLATVVAAAGSPGLPLDLSAPVSLLDLPL